MRRHIAGAALIAAVAAAPLPGPHDPAVEAAAQAALPRARIVLLAGRVSEIRGLVSATGGRVAAIRSLADDLRAAGFAVVATDAGLRVTIPEAILFDFDKAVLRPSAAPQLAKLAAGAGQMVDLPIRVEGHTDAKGTPAYNARLSLARAAAVRDWLAGHGVAAARLQAQGFGATRPVAPNLTPSGSDDPAGRQRNRRVEVVIGAG